MRPFKKIDALGPPGNATIVMVIFANIRYYMVVSSINLSLTDELRAFIDECSGEGTLYSTPSEFLRDVLREKKQRLEAAAIRDGLLEGYQDVIEGRTVEFTGDLRQTLAEAKRREDSGW